MSGQSQKERNENPLIGMNGRYSRGNVSYLPLPAVSLSKPAHLQLSALRQDQKPLCKEKGKTTYSTSRTVSILSQLLANMFPWGTSGVLLPIFQWKKACLFCQGLLNQDDLNLWGHTAGTSGRDWKVINGRFWGGVMMRQELRQCVLFYMSTDDEVMWQQNSDSPRRCVRKIQPETSGGQTLSHFYWFLCKQVSQSAGKKFKLPTTTKIQIRGAMTLDSMCMFQV